ncbi:MAG: TldD/PmbA family protein [Candidatus Lokiarchaeota archaeon]|nr:TldD/PmbA family protein [Candidatus Lokiarchaeota archaeon]
MEEFLANLIQKSINLVEYIDARICSYENNVIRFVDGITKDVISSNEMGIGIRAFKNGSWGYLCSNNISKESLQKMVDKVIKLTNTLESKSKIKFGLNEPELIKDSWQAPEKKSIKNISIEDKMQYIKNIYKQSISYDERIYNSNILYFDSIKNEKILNSSGLHLDITTSYVRNVVSNYAFDGTKRQFALRSIGGIGGWEIIEQEKAQNLGNLASEQAVRLLKAKALKAGRYSAVLDQTLAGLFVHEAFGHCCEADAILNGESVLENKLGEQVGAEMVNIVDDPTIDGLYGSYKYDSEGVLGKKKYLVKNGVLHSYLHGLESASRMNQEHSTGNARAGGYSHLPIIRMSNTLIEPGDRSLEEMVEEIREGIFARRWKYGYVDPSKGEFQFKCAEAYKIKNGEIDKNQIYADTALSGITLEVLHNITGIGKEIEFSPGTCGKEGQSAPVTDGSGYLLIPKGIVFGGLA